MINTINEAINRKLASISFTNIIIGKVMSVQPLQIKINDRIVIGQSFIEPMSLGLSDYSPNSALPLIVGETIQMIRYNNGQRFYVLGKTGTSSSVEGTSDYTQLTNLPRLVTTSTTSLNCCEEEICEKIELHRIAKSGKYDDLIGKPTLSKVAKSGKYSDLLELPSFATVATSGKYNDLIDKPTFATVATSGKYSDLTGLPSLSNVATSGKYADLLEIPTFAKVATSGSYSDLKNTPDLTQFVSADYVEEQINQEIFAMNADIMSISNAQARLEHTMGDVNDLNTESKQIVGAINEISVSKEYDSLPVGSVLSFTGTTAPVGYLICDGSLVSRAEYPGLFSVIGTAFNLDTDKDNTKFRLPNLKGKVPVGKDADDSDFATLGKILGEKAVKLTISTMPKHTHTQNAHSHQQNYYTWYNNSAQYDVRLAGSSGGYYSGAGMTGYYTDNATATNQNTGGDGAHNNIQPSIVMNYIIKASATAILQGNVVDDVAGGSTVNAPSQRAVQKYVDDKMGEGVSARVIIDRWEAS